MKNIKLLSLILASAFTFDFTAALGYQVHAANIIPVGRRNNNNMRAIEADAENFLSNFDGFGGAVARHDDYQGGDPALVGYDGYGDDLLDFDGISTTFKNEIESNRRFTISIDNSANAADQTVILFESFDPSSANVITDGAFLSVGGANLTASTPSGKIKALRAFFYQNPTRCLGFKIQSDQVSQIDKSLKLLPRIPFQNLTDKTIYFNDYTNEHVYQEKKVSIPYRFQVSNQTEVQLVVAASAKTTITFYFGAILNTHKALLVKADAASIGQTAQNVRL